MPAAKVAPAASDDVVAENQRLREENAALKAANERLKAQNDSQAAEIVQLKDSLAKATGAAKPETSKEAEEKHEAPLPPVLAEWTPIAKTEAVKTAAAGIKALEAAFLLAPTGEAAEELRAKTEKLAATLRHVIDERVREGKIVPRSDGVIAAGAETFTAIYDSVMELIKSTQAEEMKTLGNELSGERLRERVGRGGAECKQLKKLLMDVYKDAAVARPLATALVKRIAAACGITQPAEPTPLKSTVRILEKALLRPGDARGRCERVCDIVRDMIVAESAAQLARLVRAFLDEEGIVVVRVKDRFKHPSGGGWRDIMVRVVHGSPPPASSSLAHSDAEYGPRRRHADTPPPLCHPGRRSTTTLQATPTSTSARCSWCTSRS